MFFCYNVTLLLRGQNLGVDSHTKGDSSSNCKCLDILVRGGNGICWIQVNPWERLVSHAPADSEVGVNMRGQGKCQNDL